MNSLSALIIENRPLPGIVETIEQHEKFLPKGTDVYWIKNEEINSMMDYNKLMTSKRLWRNITTEKVLIFQHDSMLIRNGIEEHLEWDYTGAHIKWMPGYFNGGLSLRDTKAMIRVIDNIEWRGQNEDLYFIDGLRQLNGYLPTKEESHKFSVETEYCLGSVGYHAIDKYLTPSECNAVRNQYL